MKEISPIKEIGLYLYLSLLWGLLVYLDKVSLFFKFMYKESHKSGEIIARHVEKIMKENNLD